MANENYGTGQFYTGGPNTLSNVAINSIINYAIGGFEATLKYGLFEILDRLDRITPFNIGAQDFGPFGALNYWEGIVGSARQMNQSLGISSNLSQNIEQNVLDAYKDFVAMGGEIEDLTAAYQTFTDLTSTNRLLTKDQINELGMLRASFGEGFEQIFATLALYGKDLNDATTQVKNVYALSNRMGINASRTLKTLRDNINRLDQYTFRRGIDGLAEMVMLSERFKVSMESAFGFVEKSNNLENAIEQSAQLLVLGGEFSKLADPFTLMFTARNNPEQLLKAVTELAGAYAYLDEQAGEFRIDPYGMDQIREFGRITGIAVEELSKAAKIRALTDQIEGQFSTQIKNLENYEEAVNRIAAAAYFNKDTGQFGVDIQLPEGGTEFRTIAQINKNDLESLQAISDELSLENVYVDLINTNETLVGSIERLINTFKRYTISDAMYKMGTERVRPLLQDVKMNIEGTEFANDTKNLLEKLDEAIFNNLMGNFDDISQLSQQFSTEGIFGVSKEEMATLIRKAIAFMNNPLSTMLGISPEKKLISPFDVGRYYGERSRNWMGSFFRSEDEIEPIDKTSTESIIKLNTQNIKKSQDAIIEKILSSSLKMDKNFNNRIEFTEFTGAIKILSPDNKQIGEMEMKEIFAKLKPQLEAQIQEQIYNEIENNTKNTPKRGRANF